MSTRIDDTEACYSAGRQTQDLPAFNWPFLGITPFERPDYPLAFALQRYGAAVAIDIGRDVSKHDFALSELQRLCMRARAGTVGVRIPDHVALSTQRLPPDVGFVILESPANAALWRPHYPVIVQVTCEAEARAAVAAGAVGLIAKGAESGGRVGATGAFVLLQQILALPEVSGLPVWCQGGIGLRSAAAVFVAGARGVVLDSQLALLQESTVPPEVKAVVHSMDGSEIRVVGGYQVYSRPGTLAAQQTALDSYSVRELLGSESLQQLLPIGQDAALATSIAAQYSTVEALLKGLRMRIAGQLRQARQLTPLAADSPLARAHGTRLPIAQGPMTRVSDTAPFAISVAQHGALPFLALSLMPANAARELLERTRAGMGERSWGVGVLGFAPPAILDAHLELIQEFRPTVVILAGGRPSQARALLERDIPTYLHVPSPGLLEQFLKAGAQHFIFEGRECGGHVGPRYSFVLWEQQIEKLLAAEHPEALHVYFAGGIHDARSAAMVAALAAPLAARGAKIGVLMGSAYLTTHEAVNTGAIVEQFQREALTAIDTELIETAPGHAVRCAPSGFVDTFNQEKQRLQAQGLSPQQIWAALESFNLGRLRIASKGLERRGEALVAVDRAVQQREGMYMIGQCAALCAEVQSMARLHQSVTHDAVALLDACVAPEPQRSSANEPIAIIGMDCIFAGAADCASYWANILSGHDAVTEVPRERWNVDIYYSTDSGVSGKTNSKWGGFIDEVAFDPLQYGIPPQSLAAIEPVQLLSLEVARRALSDAGYGETNNFDRDKTSVIFGAEPGTDLPNAYLFRNTFAQYCGSLPPQLDAALPQLTEDSFPGVLANVIAGRVANRLGLGGVNYTVAAACASSLAAIELAVKELRSGNSDMVLAGGADFHNAINDYLMFASVTALSASGRCRSFDENADGICLGEGVAVVVLKRLSDAQRDGDRIYSVIEAIAGSSDGKGLGLTAPRKEGQKRALERTYWQGAHLPADIGLVEAHGTGTVVGDQTELKTLTEVFSAGGAISGQIVLGSVKSQIGHTKCAGGIAGLIKVAQSIYHRVLPPTQHIVKPTRSHHAANSPFVLNKTPRVWLDSQPRGAVSAFGFGGTNFHAVLAAPANAAEPGGVHVWPAELFVFRGEAGGQAQMRRLQEFLQACTAPVALRDLSFTVNTEATGRIACALVAYDVADLRAKLQLALANATDERIYRRGSQAPGKLAFLFPGQGSQTPGMLQELFIMFPHLRHVLVCGRDYLDALYPPTAYDTDTERAQQLALTDTRVAQPALGIVEYALGTLLKECGVQADMLGGHSYGELVALSLANSFDLPTLLRLSRQRGEAILAAAGVDRGRMAAVSGAAAAIEAALQDIDVVLANQNSPSQTVISGASAAIDLALAALKRAGIAAQPIEVSCAFHSPVIARAATLYDDALSDVTVAAPERPVYSNTTACVYPGDSFAMKAQLAQHIVKPVRFTAQIEAMYAAGARIFVEVGPRRTLSSFVEKILTDKPHHTVAMDQRGQQWLPHFLNALAQIAVLTESVDTRALYTGRAAQRVDWKRPLTLSATTWLINGQRARPLHGAPPAHAGKLLDRPVQLAHLQAQPTAVLDHTRDAAVLNFLNNVRDIVSAQRDVMLGYLDHEVAGRYEPVTPRADRVAAANLPAVLPISNNPEVAEPRTVEQVLLAIVSARTGYPAEMLDLDLDLEADLSIDSIKRMEVIGELSQRLAFNKGMGMNADALLEQLAACKTLRAMLEWLSQQLPSDIAPLAALPTAEGGDATGDSVLAPDVCAVLLSVVSERTGYPAEVLDLDLNLEADLSIDSIKRVEIIGEWLDKLGSDAATRDTALEGLAVQPTLRAMIDRVKSMSSAAPATVVAPIKPQLPLVEPPAGLGRFHLRSVVLQRPERSELNLAGKRFLITDDGRGVAEHLARRLQERGAHVQLLSFDADSPAIGEFDALHGLIHLWGLHGEHRGRDVQRFYSLMRQALTQPLKHLLVATGLAGHHSHFTGASVANDHYRWGGGLPGMLKCAAREWPAVNMRCVDLNMQEAPAELARYVERELFAADHWVEVGYRDGNRYRMELTAAPLPHGSDNSPLQLDEHSVVLITGGARGIAAAVAQSLAKRYRCKFELVGRTQIDGAEQPQYASAQYAAAKDAKTLRRLILADHPGMLPAAVEKQCLHLLAKREIRDTLQVIREAGGHANYTSLDVRDIDAFGEFIAGLYQRYGRIDGAVHAAGLIDDKLIRDKTPESFARVFETKVRSAFTLCKLLRQDVKFVVFYSSVASVFGNRGQVDYAAANDVMDKLAYSLQSRIAGRAVSINWGPWSGKGMVSPELEREYARRGVKLIALQEGIEALLCELRCGRREDVQVVYMCGSPESMGSIDPITAPRGVPAGA